MAVVTNRALDPSLEGPTGGVITSAVYGATVDDYDVKFAGVRSKRVTRPAATPSNVIGGVVMTVTPVTSVNRVRVAPGEVISISCKIRIDRPGRVKIDWVWRDAAGATIGVVNAGAYSPADTPGEWATAKLENLTAPPNTDYMYLNAYAALPVGNTIGGETAWFDALMINDGPIALPYFDGSFPSDGTTRYYWAGPVNNSISVAEPIDKTSAEYVRRAIASAASIPGVRVSPFFRQTIKVGDGMVRLERADFPNRLGGVKTWQVLIVLPQDIGAAERWLDLKIPALTAALDDELTLASVVPQELVTDAGKVPVVVLTGKREME